MQNGHELGLERLKRPLSARFDEALVLASTLHREQARKASGVPYVAHLLGVASLVLEEGGSEDMAIAALLHDAAEDQGGETTLDEIARPSAPRWRAGCGSPATASPCPSRSGRSASGITWRRSPRPIARRG